MNTKIAILGAGAAGLALAMKLLRRSDLNSEIVVIDSNSYVGGLSASFEYKGLNFDFGSHRLHPATSDEIMEDIRALLGFELLDRPRQGRIRLSGRFLKFPLTPFDLILHLPPSFIIGFGCDTVTKLFRRSRVLSKSFADALLDGLGKTICNTFYFPYSQKIWGLDPEDISIVQAQKRVSADNIFKIIYKVLSLLPGIKQDGAGRFFYPKKGFGQISESLRQEVERLGGKILPSTIVQELSLEKGHCTKIRFKRANVSQDKTKIEIASYCDELVVDFVFSTIPVTILMELLRPEPPSQIKKAAKELKYRGMILHYLILETDQFTPFDAHYFPEQNVIFSRMSEPKNYSGTQEPRGLTGLCFEIPCRVGDHIWNSSEEEITAYVVEGLKRVDLPIKSSIRASFLRRIPKAYPVYDIDFEKRFEAVDEYLTQIYGLVSLGRQGLFAHDNTHHTIEMAYRASECLKPGLTWNTSMWEFYREQFLKHVVED